MFGWNAKHVRRTNAPDLHELGKCFGLSIGKRLSRYEPGTLPEIPDKSILAVDPSRDGKRWHWVVFCNHGGRVYVVDPKPEKPDERTTRGIKIKGVLKLKPS